MTQPTEEAIRAIMKKEDVPREIAADRATFRAGVKAVEDAKRKIGTPEDLDVLRALVDRISISGVLTLLSEFADEKAEYAIDIDHDRLVSGMWATVARRLEVAVGNMPWGF